MPSLRRILAIMILVVTPVGAQAGAEFLIEGPMIRAAPNAGSTTAGYVILRNVGDADDRLMAVTSDIARSVSIHATQVKDGVMSMEALSDGVPLPAGETVILAPRGLHLMIQGTVDPLAEGQTVPLTLKFATAGPKVITFTVMSLGAILAAQ